MAYLEMRRSVTIVFGIEVCDNENFTVNSNDIADVQISIPYIGADDKI